MSRLAWFTPWMPDRGTAANRSAHAVALLAHRGHAIDVFVDDPTARICGEQHPSTPGDPGVVRVLSAHDFVWRHRRDPYDLAIYQLGHSTRGIYDFVWPYLFRWPGLVALHDTHLHGSRAHALLRPRRLDAYRAEFAWNHPDVNPAAAGLAIRNARSLYVTIWPMLRGVVLASRRIAVHNREEMDDIQRDCPERSVDYVAPGVPDRPDEGAREKFRAAYGVPDGALLFGVLGQITAERRVTRLLGAFQAVHTHHPNAQLLIAGQVSRGLELHEAIAALGLARAVRVIDLPLADRDAAIDALDVVICHEWPSTGSLSPILLGAMAAGRTIVTTDRRDLATLPTLDPRTWHRQTPVIDIDPGADLRAVSIAIDIMDEDHSLGLALRKLAADAGLRTRLGRAAREYWAREHTIDRMAADYERAIAHAMAAPIPDVTVPAHLRPDPAAAAKRWLAPFGVPLPF